jgi:hypothetical protein
MASLGHHFIVAKTQAVDTASLNDNSFAITMKDGCYPLEGLVRSQARILSDGEFQEEDRQTHGE